MIISYKNISLLVRILFRYCIVWLGDAVSIGVTALVLPGIYFIRESRFWYLNPFVVALWLALLNVLVRPVLVIMLLPINFISLGLLTLVLNATLFYFINALVPSFVINSFPAAMIGLFVLSTVNTILAGLLITEGDYSLFAKLMDKLSSFTRAKGTIHTERGTVILQIDGLSHSVLQKALRRGKMPFVRDMLARKGYKLKKWFPGLPSQTSSVQAGIFYGSSFNIPGFRWYNRRNKKQYVSSSSSDMYELDRRLGKDNNSLLEGGTCINTLIHGGAKKKLITLSVILEKDLRQRRGELEDFAIFSLHPYLYNRAVVLMVLDLIIDRVEGLMDIIRRKKPRVKRNLRFSLLRAVGNAFLRECASHFIMEDIVRRAPIIYANYIGYDIIAHHAGPHSWDAIRSLSGIDRRIRKIARTIAKKAEHSYDLIILSDHGQSKSIPFESLYHQSLSQFIREKMQTPILDATGYNAEKGYLKMLLREMESVEETFQTRSIARSRRTFEKIHARVEEDDKQNGEGEGTIVCCSGNLAHIYFSDTAEKLNLEQISSRYPGLLQSLIEHPGIGLIGLKDQNGDVIIMGKKGMRSLSSGKTEGTDPLLPYNSTGKNPKALKELCEYPDSGDVILISSILKDNFVASFEEQVGTHGGLGGEQTEAFIIYRGKSNFEPGNIDSSEEMHAFLESLKNPS